MPARTQQRGIVDVLPLVDNAGVASVSSVGVKVHSNGMLCLGSESYSIGNSSFTSCGALVQGGAHVVTGVLNDYNKLNLVDIYSSGLPVVSSISTNNSLCTKIVTSVRGSYIAGFNDGSLFIGDCNMQKLHNMGSSRRGGLSAGGTTHHGGIRDIAVSPCGNIVCTTGFSSKSSSPDSCYAFVDEQVLSYDVRMLGGGAISFKFFDVTAPLQCEFLADSSLLVATAHDVKSIKPIVPQQDQVAHTIIYPALEQLESLTCLSVSSSGALIALGTNQSNVLEYCIPVNKVYMGEKPPKPMCRPPLNPSPTPSKQFIDPSVLKDDLPPAFGTPSNLFNMYVLRRDPVSSKFKPKELKKSGILLPPPKRDLSHNLKNIVTESDGHGIPASQIGLGCERNVNPNQLIYTPKRNLVYQCGPQEPLKERQDMEGVPERYRRSVRPPGSFNFNYSKFNLTELWPGWDTSNQQSYSYIPVVVMLLYFVPEYRRAILLEQFENRTTDQKGETKGALASELGFLFHQIESLSANARIHDSSEVVVNPFVASNFITTFALSSEAVALYLVDGSGPTMDFPLRLEAFNRFILHYLNREVTSETNLIDRFQGLTFSSTNKFNSESSKSDISKSRAFSSELSYEQFFGPKATTSYPSFRDVLASSLQRNTRLRAWSDKTKKYEAVVQKKVISDISKILTISCACAGKERMFKKVWQSKNSVGGLWLPSKIRISLNHEGKDVQVSELLESDDGNTKEWSASSPSNLILSDSNSSVYELVSVCSYIGSNTTVATGENQSKEADDHGHFVLHTRVPVAYEKRQLQKQIIAAEDCITSARESRDDTSVENLTLNHVVSSFTFHERASKAMEKLTTVASSSQDDSDNNNEWILFNDLRVQRTDTADARDFQTMEFKNPCIIQYRRVDVAIDDQESEEEEDNIVGSIPLSVMNTPSISNNRTKEEEECEGEGSSSSSPILNLSDLPGEGDIVAIDAEFVLVQKEKASLKSLGSKVILKEGRSALARLSIIDCRPDRGASYKRVLMDDYVVPQEPVVDYLTRFSGIKASDLDVRKSPHHLITMRTAFLKLRALVDRKCIFVGHGLENDFQMMNISVSPSQIIDTLYLFHEKGSRFVSLRFLANFILKRDMQQDTHDSIEDARTAHELYVRALHCKKLSPNGEEEFKKLVRKLYEFGRKCDWKIGVAVNDVMIE